MSQILSEAEAEMSALCDTVRRFILNGDFIECEMTIAETMGRRPHAPQPHNLMGVLFEVMGDHAAAMKHFRAAWSLDPTFIPARHNLDSLASFSAGKRLAFDEKDLLEEGGIV